MACCAVLSGAKDETIRCTSRLVGLKAFCLTEALKRYFVSEIEPQITVQVLHSSKGFKYGRRRGSRVGLPHIARGAHSCRVEASAHPKLPKRRTAAPPEEMILRILIATDNHLVSLRPTAGCEGFYNLQYSQADSFPHLLHSHVAASLCGSCKFHAQAAPKVICNIHFFSCRVSGRKMSFAKMIPSSPLRRFCSWLCSRK